MAKYKTIRVYPDGPVWVVKKDGAARAWAVRNTKEEALKAAKDVAIKQGLAVIIHGKDGRIQKTVRPEDTSSESSGGGCFITTACVNYYGLNDNCYQLETLRGFRDSYLSTSKSNEKLVKQYYQIAPTLVALMEIDKNKDQLFENVFSEINSACEAIDKREFEQAKNIYQNTVKHLLRYFKLI
jgi:hypothetical protein